MIKTQHTYEVVKNTNKTYLKDAFLPVGHFKSPFKTQPYKYEMNRKQLIIKRQDETAGQCVLVPGLLLTRCGQSRPLKHIKK